MLIDRDAKINTEATESDRKRMEYDDKEGFRYGPVMQQQLYWKHGVFHFSTFVQPPPLLCLLNIHAIVLQHPFQSLMLDTLHVIGFLVSKQLLFYVCCCDFSNGFNKNLKVGLFNRKCLPFRRYLRTSHQKWLCKIFLFSPTLDLSDDYNIWFRIIHLKSIHLHIFFCIAQAFSVTLSIS
jgi:hypothetical protein